MGGTLRLAELTAALSLATDAGTGQPMEHALRTCLLAGRAAQALGVSPAQQSTIMYTTLLRFLGCTSDASTTAALAGGDEIAFNAAMAPIAMADDRDAVPHLVRHLGEGLPLAPRIGRVVAALSDPGGMARSLSQHCEVGARFAVRIGLPADVVYALAHAYERWDGKGAPSGLAGDAVPLATRVAVVARDVDLMCRAGGMDRTRDLLLRRRGHAYDPAVVDVFTAAGAEWIDELDRIDPWEAVLDAEPRPVLEVGEGALDGVLAAFADFADLKSPWFTGHSRAVSELAAAAAAACGLDANAVALARRVGLVHDLGVVAVPAGVWNRPGPLTAEGWERVRLHAHVSERILARCPALSEVAAGAGAHHERLDGSGYHRGAHEPSLVAQLVAASDVYQALREPRPHRAPLDANAAAGELAVEADAGRLDRRATDAVLASAGHAVPVPSVARPAGLTEREVDVVRLLARGCSNKEAARELGISAKTVGTHVEHIYAKAGVTTRAGVTLFAMEHGLLRT